MSKHFIETYTGKLFSYEDINPESICIEDIAHHLSLLCRFTGACKEFYSVAEHSFLVACQLPKELRIAALLHDAHEAYTGDLNTPLKAMCNMEDVGDSIQQVINSKYRVKLDLEKTKKIKEADLRLLATEARDLMNTITVIEISNYWSILPAPLDDVITPHDSRWAKTAFLISFYAWGGEDD